MAEHGVAPQLPRRASRSGRVCAQGWLDVCRTSFIILMLLLGTLLFIQDNDRLVLRPLERMVRKARACVCVVVCVGGQGHAAANAHPVALAGAGEASG